MPSGVNSNFFKKKTLGQSTFLISNDEAIFVDLRIVSKETVLSGSWKGVLFSLE